MSCYLKIADLRWDEARIIDLEPDMTTRWLKEAMQIRSRGCNTMNKDEGSTNSTQYKTSSQAYRKCSVCLGPSKVMGKIFCHMCMKHTSQVHSVKSLWAGFRPGAFWHSLVQSAPIFEPFLCKYYFFNFLVLNIFCRVNFFLGPAVPWSCGFCRPASSSKINNIQVVWCRLIHQELMISRNTTSL